MKCFSYNLILLSLRIQSLDLTESWPRTSGKGLSLIKEICWRRKHLSPCSLPVCGCDEDFMNPGAAGVGLRMRRTSDIRAWQSLRLGRAQVL